MLSRSRLLCQTHFRSIQKPPSGSLSPNHAVINTLLDACYLQQARFQSSSAADAVITSPPPTPEATSLKREQHLASKSAARLKKVDLRALTKSNAENQYLHIDVMEEGLTASIYRQVLDFKDRRAKEEAALVEAEDLKKKEMASASDGASASDKSGTTAAVAKTTAGGGDIVMDADMINATGKATPKQIRQLFHDSVKARTVANVSLRKYLRSLPPGEAVLAKAAVEGAESAGLVLDSDTAEQYLELLMSSGFLLEGLQLYQQMVRNKSPPNTRAYNCLMRLCVTKHANESALKLFDEMASKGRQQDKESYEIALNAIASEKPVDWVRAVQIFEKATGGTQQALRRANLQQEEAEAEEARQGSEYPGVGNARTGSSHATSTDAGGGTGMMRALSSKSLKNTQQRTGGADQGDMQGLPASSAFVGGRHHTGTGTISASTYNALMRVYLNMDPFEWRVVYNCYYEMRNSRPKIRITWESYHLVAEAMRRGEAGRFRRLLTYLDAWFQLTNLGSWRFISGLFVYCCIGMLVKTIMGFFVQRTIVNTNKTVISR